jgi:hypothetical protein
MFSVTEYNGLRIFAIYGNGAKNGSRHIPCVFQKGNPGNCMTSMVQLGKTTSVGMSSQTTAVYTLALGPTLF